jgi:uncharacterized DUF497 family protein
MGFEWGGIKRRLNAERHDIDFLDAVALFDGRPVYVYASPRGNEERLVTVGEMGGRMVAVIWTRRGENIRIISARRARGEEKGEYRKHTAEEIAAMIARGESMTDWAAVDAKTEEELEADIAADPAWNGIPRDWVKHAKPGLPFRTENKRQVTLRLDPDVLDFFKGQGKRWQSRINAVLRSYVEAAQRR